MTSQRGTRANAGWRVQCIRLADVRAAALSLTLLMLTLAGQTIPAQALDPIDISATQQRLEITFLGQFYEARGDRLQVETAAGDDGITGRMAVRAITPGTDPNWAVFALANPTDNAIERWLIAERYTLPGSGVIWPDLDSPRIVRVTPSLGFLPERVANDQADIVSITIEPGQTVTFVAELASERFPRLYLWNPAIYQQKQRESMLFQGVLIGITLVIAIFLTSIFAANHKAIFPTSALIAWSVLGYLCIDFGFWHKLFQVTPQDSSYYRAAAEAAIPASIVLFLYTFLRVNLWHGWIRMFFLVWAAAQVATVGLAMLDPTLAASIARVSFLSVAVIGTLLVLYLSLRGQDRAISLIAPWLLLLVWIFGAAVTVMGRLSGDVVGPVLTSGLVVILLVLAITVTQNAFRTLEPMFGASPNQLETRSLAIDAANAGLWEWNARRDEIATGNLVEESLGLQSGELNCRVNDWIDHVHQGDRERLKLVMNTIQEHGDGHIGLDLRLRRSDSTYRWYELEAATLPQTENRNLKCVGLLRDVTDVKRAHERLVQDAVKDTLTGLPNRQLFIDRLGCAISRAKELPDQKPTVMLIDIDRFKNVNNGFGLIVGDSMLLTISRRLSRHLGPRDTLARIGGDQFAVLVERSLDTRNLAMLAERIRRALRAPVKIHGQAIVLTGSIGVVEFDGTQADASAMMRSAEAAMYEAKRAGSDRTEVLKPGQRTEHDDRLSLESDLRHAVERGQIRVLFQPIVRLGNSELAGFEALARWQHPKRGLINPEEFIPIAEEIDIISGIGSHVLERSREEVARWQNLLPRREDPLFVSINISSRQLFRAEFVQELRNVLRSEQLERGTLRLEITESLAMENPEHAAEVLDRLKEAGASLSIDDFGTGFCSLGYLHRFAFDTIKLDKALVQNHAVEGTGGVIVRTVVAMAHELGKDVVAEGVENYEDAIALRGMGCEYAQGFFFGEAMTDREVTEMLRTLAKTERRSERLSLFETAIRMLRSFEGKSSETDSAPDATAATSDGPVDAEMTAQRRPAAAKGGKPPRPAMPPKPTPAASTGAAPRGAGGAPTPGAPSGRTPQARPAPERRDVNGPARSDPGTTGRTGDRSGDGALAMGRSISRAGPSSDAHSSNDRTRAEDAQARNGAQSRTDAGGRANSGNGNGNGRHPNGSTDHPAPATRKDPEPWPDPAPLTLAKADKKPAKPDTGT